MVFCYEREDNAEIVEAEFPIGQAPEYIEFDAFTQDDYDTTAEGGMTVTQCRVRANRSLRAEGSKFSGLRGNPKIKNTGKNIWPMKSDALGCGPKQIGEFREKSKKAGCATDFTPDGRAIITSPGHKKKVMKWRGLHDRNAFC